MGLSHLWSDSLSRTLRRRTGGLGSVCLSLVALVEVHDENQILSVDGVRHSDMHPFAKVRHPKGKPCWARLMDCHF